MRYFTARGSRQAVDGGAVKGSEPLFPIFCDGFGPAGANAG
jgi:hypothetical protein